MLPQMDDLSLGSLKPVVEAAMRGYSEGDENLLTKAADTVNWRLQGNARELKTLLIQRRVLMDEAARLEDSVKDLRSRREAAEQRVREQPSVTAAPIAEPAQVPSIAPSPAAVSPTVAVSFKPTKGDRQSDGDGSGSEGSEAEEGDEGDDAPWDGIGA